MLAEQWKSIKGYKGIYEISNFGNVKSLPNNFSKKRKILKPYKRKGYLSLRLCKQNIQTKIAIHQLVWDHFGDKERNGRILQIDHIDNNKLNNQIDNLQLLTHRENTAKSKLNHTKSSKYTGVSWSKEKGGWISQIQIRGKHIQLGKYLNEEDASKAYILAKRNLSI